MYKILNGEFETVTYEEACIYKGIKPINKPLPHKMNKKDRKKEYPLYNSLMTTQEYVNKFLTLNHLVRLENEN